MSIHSLVIVFILFLDARARIVVAFPHSDVRFWYLRVEHLHLLQASMLGRRRIDAISTQIGDCYAFNFAVSTVLRHEIFIALEAAANVVWLVHLWAWVRVRVDILIV